MSTENNPFENEQQNIGHNEELIQNDNHLLEGEIHEDEFSAHSGLSLPEILQKLEEIVNKKDAGLHAQEFNKLRQEALHHISEETEDKKHSFVESGQSVEHFNWEHPSQSKLTGLHTIFKEKLNSFNKIQEEQQEESKQHRLEIIEKLKNLYTNSEPGTNLFKEIRKIKEEWSNAGQIAKKDFKILNNNYFHHLNQFYALLDLNKEFLEQEYAHNLEKRQHIISRAKELETEPVIQKALNELQYLHKLWKEEAEPVAEEFRETTWEEFKEISNKIHERKSELSAEIEKTQQDNLDKKIQIINTIRGFINSEKENNHNFWQNAIKRTEELRTEFLKIGSVPRKISNQNWTDFKQTLREFNSKKNTFYKSLKDNQIGNLDAKLKLIQIAKDNMHSEDWDVTVPLFKKLQEDWKNIGHVPRAHANRIWDDFREACNTFFDNYRTKNNAVTDNWKENFKNKKALIEELKAISEDKESQKEIERIKNAWNAIGKVPREKMGINKEFNQVLKEKLRLNHINEFELKEDGLTGEQLTDKARKIKNQIIEMEAEVVKLENNLGFFNNPSRENPLLKDTFNKIDEKKVIIENLKQSLHQIISGE